MQSVARVLDQTEASRSCGPGDSSLEGCTCCCIASVVSDSVRPHRRQPTRLPHPWDSPGKNTGVGSHFLLQCMRVKSESEVTQSCPTLNDPMAWLQPTRLLRPWEFPGEGTGVGCHCLLWSLDLSVLFMAWFCWMASFTPKLYENIFLQMAISRYGWGFPGSSAGKKSICNAGDPGLNPRMGRSPGEGIGYPLQYSWASLVAQMVKNLLAMQETWVWSLGWEDSLKESMATHSSFLSWRITMDRGAWQARVHGVIIDSDMIEWPNNNKRDDKTITDDKTIRQ